MTTSTDDLIEGLANRLVPVPRWLLERRLAWAVVFGATIVLALVTGVVGLRPDMANAVADSSFWAKLVFTGSVALLALAGARNLARPDVSSIKLAYFAVPIGILVVLAVFELNAAPADRRSALVFGVSWRECPVLITMLAVPLLAILLRLFSGFAPERPRLTGAIVGVAAGATTAMLYSLHCPETAMTFLLLWYGAGIAIVGAIGAIVGPRFMRW